MAGALSQGARLVQVAIMPAPGGRYRQERVDVVMGGAVTTAKGADYFPGGNHAAAAYA